MTTAHRTESPPVGASSSGSSAAEASPPEEPPEPPPCPFASVAVTSEAPLDGPPPHDRLAWAQEAVAFADTVARARSDGEEWVLEEVVCGAPTGPRLPRYALRGPHEEGVALRVLARSPGGYVDVAPDGGLTDAEWADLSTTARTRGPSDMPDREERQLSGSFTSSEGSEHNLTVTLLTNFVRFELSGEGAAPRLTLSISAEGLLRVLREPERGRGYDIGWAGGELLRFRQFVDGEREGLEHVTGSSGRWLAQENRYRAGHAHGVQRRFDPDGSVTEETVYEDGLLAPVIHPTTRVEGTELHLPRYGPAYYSAPETIVARMRVGMTLQQVADALGQRVSEATGVSFPRLCEPGTRLRLARGRVVGIGAAEPLGSCMDAL